MRWVKSLSVLLAAFAATGYAQNSLDLDNEITRVNYSLGYQIGGDFKRQGLDIDAEAVVKGIEDALLGAEPLLAPEVMQNVLIELKRKVTEERRERDRNAELEAIEQGQAFLAENAQKKGVVTLPSGLQYKVIEAGSGRSPGPKDMVTIHYRAQRLDGLEYDSSYRKGEPATFQADSAIKGWSEGLQLMREGAHWQLFIPQNLAHGKRGPLAHQTLIFDVELLKVAAPDPQQNQTTTTK